MASTVSTKLTYLLGKCLPRVKPKVARISVQKLDFDNYLHMYFKKHEVYLADDPDEICKSGDTVLIQQLPQKLTRCIEHKVIEVVYPMGDVIDPITGKAVTRGKYRDEEKKLNELYGINESAFDYNKAPPRGRLEGTLDLTDKPTYKQYIVEDPNNPQPYAHPK